MNNDENKDIENYYNAALNFTKSHYENFPVISFFVRKDLRKHVAAIYQFARQADDLADEGNFTSEERIKQLEKYELDLLNSLKSNFKNGFWEIVKNTISINKLSESNFTDLLSAFKQDVVKDRYQNYDELLGYCKRSANPIGRLILELNEIRDENAFSYSDKICTALQLTNFYQDVSVDIKKNRIYLPLNEIEIFSVEEFDIRNMNFTEDFVKLMKYEVERTKKLFIDGRKLLNYLPYKLKVQILVTIKGGEAILKKIEELNYNTLNFRPTVSKLEIAKLFISSLFLRS